MKLNMLFKIAALSTLLFLVGCSSSSDIKPVVNSTSYTKQRTPENFNDYVQFLKGKAAAEGVSLSVLNAQNNILYMQKAVDLDREQAGKIRKRDPNSPPVVNPNGTSNYFNRVLTQNKVNVAGERYWEVQAPLQKASQKYGVQQEYLLALWGMESSFGHYQGKYDVLSAVATLAFEGRREKLFTKEFISAMKMLEKDHIQRERMLGSWAGAMGQTQFMPSTFLRYAADGNNDGVKDIWKNQFDTFASIANYLHTVGWDNSLPWGVEVMLTQPIDLSYSGTESNKARSLKDWQAMGLILKSANPQEQAKLSTLENAQLWLVRPDREAGRAFLVSNNFRTILDWNKSNYFALSIGMFAERIKDNVGL